MLLDYARGMNSDRIDPHVVSGGVHTPPFCFSPTPSLHSQQFMDFSLDAYCSAYNIIGTFIE